MNAVMFICDKYCEYELHLKNKKDFNTKFNYVALLSFHHFP